MRLIIDIAYIEQISSSFDRFTATLRRLGPGEDNCYSYDEFTSVNEKLFNNSYSLGE